MAETKRLGDMLKEAGLIDDFQLESALSHQRNWGGKLGAILIELEFVKEEDIARIISEKLRCPYINLFEPEIPDTIIKLIKSDDAKKYYVVPAKKDKTSLTLAMSDPLDIEAIDEIRFITGLTVKPALAMESEIRDAIRKYYDHEEFVRKQTDGPFPSRGHSDGGKMELIRGSDLTMSKSSENDAASPILSKEESMNRALMDNKIRIDALITLLIEKELITRDEIVSMVYQKKLGV